jgi:hypothetical protein
MASKNKTWNSKTSCYEMVEPEYYCTYDNGECHSTYHNPFKPIVKPVSKPNYECCKIEKVDECLFEDQEYNRFYIKNQFKQVCKCSCCINEVVNEYPLNGTKAKYIKNFELNLKTCAGAI